MTESEADTAFTRKIVATHLSRSPAPAAAWIAVLSTLVLMLVSSLIWSLPGAWEDLTVASREAVYGRHEYWRLWTATLTHADFKHLLSNALLFFVLGYFLTAYFGLVMFPILAFVLGGVINAVAVASYRPEVQLLGASGVVYWMGGAWLVLYLLIDRRRSWKSRWLRVFGVSILLFVPSEAFDPSISYRTHFIGFVIGLLTGLLYYAANFTRLRAAEVVEWNPVEPEAEIDALRTEGGL